MSNKKKHGKRYTEEQIIEILQEVELGRPVAQVCRDYQVSEPTFRNWRKKFEGLTVPDIRRMRQLEGENRKLRKIVADQAMEIESVKELLSKKW